MKRRMIFSSKLTTISLACSLGLGTVIAVTQVIAAALPAKAATSDSAQNIYYAQGQDALSQEKLVDAEQLFRRALSFAQSNPSSSPSADKCMLKLAGTLALRNQTAEAQSLYQKVLDMRIKKYGSSSSEVVPVYMTLGSIQESLGNHSQAIIYYQKALAINEKSFGPYSPEFAGSLHALGRAKSKSGKKQEAVAHYKQGLSILMKEPGLGASKQLESLMQDYTDLLKNNDDSDKSLIQDFDKDIDGNNKPNGQIPVNNVAIPNSTESAWQAQSANQASARRDTQLNEDPQVALRGIEQPGSNTSLSSAYKILNDSIVKQARYGQGEEYYKRMIAVDLDSLGPNHPSVANDMNGLAQFYIGQKKYADAEPLASKAFAIYKQTYGMDNLLSISSCASLALIKFHLGYMDKARELYRVALSNSQSALGPNHFETARILNELAYLYFHQGKSQEASTYYKWAIASTEASVGENSPLLASCLKDYARVLRSMDKSAEAATIEKRADSILTASNEQSISN